MTVPCDVKSNNKILFANPKKKTHQYFLITWQAQFDGTDKPTCLIKVSTILH